MKTNAIAVARTLVGNNSGSQTAIHVYCPDTKVPLNAAAKRIVGSVVDQRNTAGTEMNAEPINWPDSLEF